MKRISTGALVVVFGIVTGGVAADPGQLLDAGHPVQALAELAGVNRGVAVVRGLAASGRLAEAESAYRNTVSGGVMEDAPEDCGLAGLDAVAVPAGRGEKLRYRVTSVYRYGGEDELRIIRQLGQWELDLDLTGENVSDGVVEMGVYVRRVRSQEGRLPVPPEHRSAGGLVTVGPSFGVLPVGSGGVAPEQEIWAWTLAALFPPTVPGSTAGPVEAGWLFPEDGGSVGGWLCAEPAGDGSQRLFFGALSGDGRQLEVTFRMTYRREAQGVVLEHLESKVHYQTRASLESTKLIEVEVNARLLDYSGPTAAPEPAELAGPIGRESTSGLSLLDEPPPESESAGWIRVKPDSNLVVGDETVDSEITLSDSGGMESAVMGEVLDPERLEPANGPVAELPAAVEIGGEFPVAPESELPASPLTSSWPSTDQSIPTFPAMPTSSGAPALPPTPLPPAAESDHPARRLLEERRFGQALTLLNSELQREPSGETYLLLAKTYVALRQDDRAALVFAHKALTRKPTPEAYGVAGELYHRLGFYPEAISNLRQAGWLDEEKTYALADSLIRTGEIEAGKAMLLELLSTSPGNRIAERTRERLESL